MVASLRRAGGVPTLLDDARDEVGVVAAGRVRGVQAPAELLAEVFGGAQIDEVDAPPGLAGRWRVTQAIEAVAYPTRRGRHGAPRPRPPGGPVPVVRRAARGAAVRSLWT